LLPPSAAACLLLDRCWLGRLYLLAGCCVRVVIVWIELIFYWFEANPYVYSLSSKVRAFLVSGLSFQLPAYRTLTAFDSNAKFFTALNFP